MKTIEKRGEGLIIEKKSKFIANAYFVQSIEEAENKIEEIKRLYHDARHNTYAYRILQEGTLIERQTDDGEPSGTAGSPMLGILKKRKLENVLIIVTRYFGGILLGTGGLVKAYSDASIMAIENAGEVEKEEGYLANVIVEYEMQREFEYICEKNNIKIVSKEYMDKIKNLIEISKQNYKVICQINDKNKRQNFPISIIDKIYTISTK